MDFLIGREKRDNAIMEFEDFLNSLLHIYKQVYYGLTQIQMQKVLVSVIDYINNSTHSAFLFFT